MNIKEYIESGIIESYVLGFATEAEQKQFEALYEQYPQIVQAKHAFELALEEQLIRNGIAPPPHIKEKIFKSLDSTAADNAYSKPQKYLSPVRTINVWKGVAAAVIIFLAITCYYNYTITGRYHKLQRVNNQLKDQIADLAKVNFIKSLDTIVQKPSTKWAALIEPTNSFHCMAHVFWDTLSKDIYLLVGNIPGHVSQKQFQLWAVAGDRSVNLGIFDVTKEGQVLQMKDANSAKAFIITLEPKGGSTTPTMGALYAKGNL